MKECLRCRYARWKMTSNGRMHPSGDGRCGYSYVVPTLPGAFYWISGVPSPCGGFINRREKLKEDCVYFKQPISDENP